MKKLLKDDIQCIASITENGVVIYAWQTNKDGNEIYPSYFKVASNNVP
jgi:hypothetical protein